jgi:hypothetical protein
LLFGDQCRVNHLSDVVFGAQSLRVDGLDMEDGMATKFTRQDFVIKDLAVSVAAGGGRIGTWMPGPDDETPPTTISPIASIVFNQGILEAVRATIAEAIKAKRFDDIGAAFVVGGTGGNAAIRAAIQEVGATVVAATAYAGLGGGSAGMPNPECGGSSWETIPTTISPVVHWGRQVHRVTDLPRLRKQLTDAVAYLDKATAAQAPRGAEVATVRAQLEGALRTLPAK